MANKYRFRLLSFVHRTVQTATLQIFLLKGRTPANMPAALPESILSSAQTRLFDCLNQCQSVLQGTPTRLSRRPTEHFPNGTDVAGRVPPAARTQTEPSLPTTGLWVSLVLCALHPVLIRYNSPWVHLSPQLQKYCDGYVIVHKRSRD